VAKPILFDTATDLGTETTSQQFQGAEYGFDASFFLVHFEPGQGPRLHRHAYPEVFILADGEATFTVDGAEYVARGGQTVVVPAGAAHKFRNSGSVRLELTSIHPVGEMSTEWLEVG
jgi:mannose-6-phosphate isomerase-like protein (cupin superfamily)